MITVTATDFKKHFGKFSQMAQKEEIAVTSFGKVIYKTVPTKKAKIEIAKSLIGILPDDATIGIDPDERN